MNLLVVTSDPVHGSALADGLRRSGHAVVRAWGVGEAMLLARREPPSLVIIDCWHGDEPEATKLAGHLVEQRLGLLWLGRAEKLPSVPSNVFAAALESPCSPDGVAAVISEIVRLRSGSDIAVDISGLKIVST